MVSPHDQCKRSDRVDRFLESSVDSLPSHSSVNVPAASVEAGKQVDMKDFAVPNATESLAAGDFNSDRSLTDFNSSGEEIFRSNDILIKSKYTDEQDLDQNQNGFVKTSKTKFDSETIDDIQKFLKMSGFSVAPNLDRMPLNDSKLLAFPKITVSNSSSVFSEYTSNASMHWSTCSSRQALKNPVLSMSDIAVVVPPNMPLAEPVIEDTVVEIGDEDAEMCVANTFVAVSGSLETSIEMCTSETSNQSSSPSSPSQCYDQISDISKSFLDSQCSASCSDEAQMSVETGYSESSSVNDVSDSSVGENDRSKLGEDFVAVSTPEFAPENSEHDSFAALSCEELSAPDENLRFAKSENAENVSSVKDYDKSVYFEDFSDEETRTVSDWQYVSSAKHKQKRKQNRNPPSSRPLSKQQQNSARSSLGMQRKEHEKRGTFKPDNDLQRTIPNRFLRLKAKNRSIMASRENHVSFRTCTNSYTSSTSTSNHSKTVDSLKKTTISVHSSFQNNVSASVGNSKSNDQSANTRTQLEPANVNSPTIPTMNGATLKPSEPVQVHQTHSYPSNSALQAHGNMSAVDADPAISHIGQSVAVAPPPVLLADRPKLDGAELMLVLKRQLEYYFSSDNLSQDSYLNSQMDSDQWVPIWIIATFNAVRRLTDEFNLVVEALRGSSLVEVDEKGEKVRPNQNLCAVILREIPDGTTKEEIEALFEGATAKLTSCNYAGNTNWYVIFQTEGDAQSAYRHLRENVREFKGKTILARIKSKLHHVSTYSQKTEVASYPTPVDPVAQSGNPQMAQQITSPPMDYIPQQFVLYAPPPHFASASPHIAGHMTASVPPFLPRVGPTPATPVASNAPVSGSPVAINPHFMSVVSHPSWPAANIYSSPDGQVMRPQLASPFVQPTFKPHPHHQYQQPASRSSSTGRRTSDFQEGANQKNNNYPQQKASSSGFVPQQQQPNSAIVGGNQTQPYYMIADPNSTTMQSDVIQYVQTDQSAVAYVPQSVPGIRPVHYLPAVNANFVTRAPFITPNANDPNLVMTPAHPQHVNILSHGISYHPPNPAVAPPRAGYYPSDQNNTSSAYHVRHPGSTRLSTGSHHELSPRFHNGQLLYSGAGHAYNGVVYRSNSRDASSADSKLNNSTNSGYGDQHKGHSPSASGADYHPDSPRVHPSGNDCYPGDDHMKRHSSLRRNTSAPFNSAFHDQRNFHQGMERRNPRLRRGRRPEDEHTPNSYTTTTPFNFEIQSFPPLPTSTAMPVGTPLDQHVESKPVIADVVKGVDTMKDLTSKENPVPVSSRKTSDSFSDTKTSIQSKPGRATKNSEAKTMSAVNTQLVADKNPPISSRQQRSSTDDKSRDNSIGRGNRSRADATNKSSNSSKKPNSDDSSSGREENSASVGRGASVNEQNALMKLLSIEEKEPTGKDAEAVFDELISSDDIDHGAASADAKPTYAQMLKIEKAAAAAQSNGKSMSDSEKSDSGDESRTDEESKEKAAPEPSDQATKSRPNASLLPDANRRGGMNRRGNYEPRRGGSWSRYYHDRNDDHRRNMRRDWGSGQYRGRGGYRGRRMFRDNRYHNNPGPVLNGHSNVDR